MAPTPKSNSKSEWIRNGNGDIPHFVVTNGDGAGAETRLSRVDPLCSLKVARASKISADGNFRRSLVGSLRALTSAEMAARRCIAAQPSPPLSEIGRAPGREGVRIAVGALAANMP